MIEGSNSQTHLLDMTTPYKREELNITPQLSTYVSMGRILTWNLLSLSSERGDWFDITEEGMENVHRYFILFPILVSTIAGSVSFHSKGIQAQISSLFLENFHTTFECRCFYQIVLIKRKECCPTSYNGPSKVIELTTQAELF